MGKFGFTKFLFFNKTTRVFDGVMNRFYEQIISGMWALSICVLIENNLNEIIIHKHNVNFIGLYLFFGFTSIIFAVSSFALPRIRQRTLRIEIQTLLRKQKINASQKLEILEILKDTLSCKDIFSKEGFWQFVMSNLFNFTIVTFYFALESALSVLYCNTSHIFIASIFALIFIMCILLEWALDSFFTRKFLGENNSISFEKDVKKQLVISVMSIIGRDSFRSSMSQIIFEDAIDDVLAILNVQTQKLPSIKDSLDK